MEIPIEVIQFHIVPFLDYWDVNSLCRTCKTIEKGKEMMWNVLCKRDFGIGVNQKDYLDILIGRRILNWKELIPTMLGRCKHNYYPELYEIASWGLGKVGDLSEVDIKRTETKEEICLRRMFHLLYLLNENQLCNFRKNSNPYLSQFYLGGWIRGVKKLSPNGKDFFLSYFEDLIPQQSIATRKK